MQYFCLCCHISIYHSGVSNILPLLNFRIVRHVISYILRMFYQYFIEFYLFLWHFSLSFLDRVSFYAPNFEKVGSILVLACPCVRPCVQTDGYSGGYKVWTIRHTSSHL